MAGGQAGFVHPANLGRARRMRGATLWQTTHTRTRTHTHARTPPQAKRRRQHHGKKQGAPEEAERKVELKDDCEEVVVEEWDEPHDVVPKSRRQGGLGG